MWLPGLGLNLLDAAPDDSRLLTRLDTRPVSVAFTDVRRRWDLDLCYEDAALSEPWADALELGMMGVVPDSARVLDLTDLELASAEEVADAILAKSDQADALLRFRLEDVAGCVTAIPTERRAADGWSWEPVVPVLDRTIDMPSAATYSEALVVFSNAMSGTGLDFRLLNHSNPEIACSVPGGIQVARQVLGTILRCRPEASFFKLLTDGNVWGLHVPGLSRITLSPAAPSASPRTPRR